MVQLVKVETFCDSCYEEGQQQVDAVETVTVAYDKRPFIELDLCADHLEDFQVWQKLAANAGRQLKKGRPAKQPAASSSAKRAQYVDEQVCPECGQACRGTVGLATHTRSVHGKTSNAETEPAASTVEAEAG